MLTPVTTLDQRYSSPAATAAGWEQTRRVLETAELFWLSTVRADSRPHVTPVVAVWAEEAICFSTGAGEQKFANLRANPHVVLTTGCNQWDQGVDVVVEGDAVQVTDEGVLKRLAAAGGPPKIVRIPITNVLDGTDYSAQDLTTEFQTRGRPLPSRCPRYCF